MTKQRCFWVGNDPLYQAYHDESWGKPLYDDQSLYEMFLLETFQAGLSWLIILKRREAFRKAFDNFDVNKIANYQDVKVQELLNDSSIIRNKRKILAAINNAKIFQEIQKEYGSFANYLWSFTNGKIIYLKDNKPVVKNKLSDTISQDLKKRGMSFVGSVTIYSYLEAVGVLNNHQKGCYLHVE